MRHQTGPRRLTGAVLWGLCIAVLLGWPGGVKVAPPTLDRVAAAYDAADATGRKPMDVFALFADEAAHVRAQGFTLKSTVVDINNPVGWYGRTVICEQGCGERILLLRDWFWSEAMARAVIAHEIGHLVFHDAGLPQSEAKADLFAACFGTTQAREYAARWFKATGECAGLRRALIIQKEQSPA